MKNQDINVDEEAVNDRWSRYIGAMGVEAFAKQAAANILLQDCNIKSISNEEHALVELLPGAKHKFEDGDKVLFTVIDSMDLLKSSVHLGE